MVAPASCTRQLPLALRAILLGLAYLVGGMVSLATGLIVQGPTGQSAVVWLPPGIALAGLLVWTRRAWPGVFLGAFVVDWLISRFETPAAGLGTHALLALVVSSASALQAVTAATLVERFDPTFALARPRAVLAFLGCVAAACLIAPTIGSVCFVLVGVRKLDGLLLDWQGFWVSETTGSFLVAPVLLAWTARPGHLWRPRRLQLTLPLALTLVLVATAYKHVTRLETERAEATLDLRVDHLATSLEAELAAVDEADHALHDLILAKRTRLTRQQFAEFARHQRERHPSVTGAAWLPRVTLAERAEHELRSRADGAPHYEIRDLLPGGRITRAPPRPEYFPMELLDSKNDVVSLSGVDLGVVPGRRELLARARRESGLVMSEPLELLRPQASDRLGTLIVEPVYAHAGESVAAPERLVGFALFATQVVPLMRELLRREESAGLVIELLDPSAAPEHRLLYATGGASNGPARAAYGATRDVTNGGRTWRLHAEPTNAYLAAARSWTGPAMSAVGFSFAALLCGFLLVTTGHAASIQRLVAARTQELVAANDQLRDAIAIHERTGRALQESEARWQFALEEAGQGLWDVDLRHDRIYWSPRLLAVLGYAETELEPSMERWARLMHPDDLPAARRLLEEHLCGRSPSFACELRMRRKDGSYIWLLTQAKVVARDPEGKPLRIIGTQIDISERKRSEQELEALVRARTGELEQARIAAETANRTKSLFLANMSHELRTPMHAVLAFARLALEGELPPKERGFVARVVESGERLLTLLNDLLDLSKLEAGKAVFRREPCDLEELAREVLHELEPLFGSKRLELRTEREPDCNTVAPVDRQRVAQLLRNLLANAVRFSSEGGRISLRFADAHPIGLPPSDGPTPSRAVAVSVSDEGVGIPEAELELVFDSFVQSSKTRSTTGGTGLGLAICRQIATQHGGTIRARNNPRGGATFVLVLPSDAGNAEEARVA